MTHSGYSTTVTLPGGYVDEFGARHREVELAMMTGEDEYFLATRAAHTCAAAVITELLARCVRRVGAVAEVTPSLIRELLVGDRDYLLIKLREVSFGATVRCVLTCPRPACGEKMESLLNLSELGFESRPVEGRYFDVQVPRGEGEAAQACETAVEVRLPTGGDQELLSALFRQNPAAAADELFARCVGRGTPPRVCADGAARSAVEEAIGRLSPDVEIEIEAACPACGAAVETSLDFTAHFLGELRANLQGIEREVHFLAWHYHWSEHDILSMTRDKRRRYVALLQAEVDRLNQVW